MDQFENKASVTRVREAGERDATVLENGCLRVMIDDEGGMVPELSLVQGKSRINAHWIPWFRSNSGKPFRDAEHGSFWKGGLLYNLAGNFPCLPNFGPGHIVDGVVLPPHGWTANLVWKFEKNGTDEETGAAFAVSSMESPDKAMDIGFKKIDALMPGERVHYISLRVTNRMGRDLDICAGWHNTLGSPFLAPGCKISGAADLWTTPPLGGEFDATSSLVPGTEFSSLKEAPGAGGKKTDLSTVPGPTGFTDFAAGRIGDDVHLGWSSLVNPVLKAAYICFFTGPASAAADDIILRFNNLWMQYGGRPFTPWAACEGGTDLAYCLGTENSISAYAYGLEYARRAGKLLGVPATITIPAGSARTLRYGCLLAPYGKGRLDEGIDSIEADASALVCKGKSEFRRFGADPLFKALKLLEGKLTP
jgi:hypothetical protein